MTRSHQAPTVADADLLRHVRRICLEADAARRRRPGLDEIQDELRRLAGEVGRGRIARALRRLIDAREIPDRRLSRGGREYRLRPEPGTPWARDRTAALAHSAGHRDAPDRPPPPPPPGPCMADLIADHLARERRNRRPPRPRPAPPGASQEVAT